MCASDCAHSKMKHWINCLETKSFTNQSKKKLKLLLQLVLCNSQVVTYASRTIETYPMKSFPQALPAFYTMAVINKRTNKTSSLTEGSNHYKHESFKVTVSSSLVIMTNRSSSPRAQQSLTLFELTLRPVIRG